MHIYAVLNEFSRHEERSETEGGIVREKTGNLKRNDGGIRRNCKTENEK